MKIVIALSIALASSGVPQDPGDKAVATELKNAYPRFEPRGEDVPNWPPRDDR